MAITQQVQCVSSLQIVFLLLYQKQVVHIAGHSSHGDSSLWQSGSQDGL